MQEWEEQELERREAREEGKKEGIEKGIKEGIKKGFQDGLNKGEDLFALLTEKLLEDARTDDLKRAVADTAFRERLYREYGVK